MNLKLLQSFLTGLDPSSLLPAGLTSSISYNQQLGYGSDAFSPFQFIPWGSWKNYSPVNAPVPSVLELSFAETIVQGHLVNLKVDTNHSFIDILHLSQPDPIFFTEPLTQKGQPTQSLIETIATTVDAMDPSITPVIRFLVGNPTPPGSICPTEFTDVFWPKGIPIFQHPNAQLYVGTYNPNVTMTEYLGYAIESWISSLWTGIETNAVNYLNSVSPDIGAYVANQFDTLDNWAEVWSTLVYEIGKHMDAKGSPVSWNHAKIVAVNGRALLTGGGNYYDLYSSQGNGSLIDNDITILGDVAMDAHTYADYLWTYLSNIPSYDTSSVVWSAPLATLPTGPSGTIPIFAGNNIPLFPTDVPLNPGKVAVLSTNKIGNVEMGDITTSAWHSMQIFAAIRDLVWQGVWALSTSWALDPAFPGNGINIGSVFISQTDDPSMVSALDDFYVTPTAWASRVARNYAIEYANTSVCVAQQMIVNWQQKSLPEWDSTLVPEVNENLNLNGTAAAWNGMIWPYDLMTSLSSALSRIAGNNPTGGNPDAGIFIVVSEYQSGLTADDGYGDMTPLSVFRQRLTDYMSGMALLNLLPVSTDVADVPGIVNQFFHIKRSVFANGPVGQPVSHKLHAKVVYVDGELLFTGSDNAYVQYNDQFGVWIEETDNIAAWKKQFFDGLWERALERN